MKTARMLFTVATVTLFAYGTAMTQNTASSSITQKVRDARLRDNCLIGLRSDNKGVIESVLLLVMDVKIQRPDFVLGELSKAIDSLAASSRIPSIRYKALLAAQVCESPESFVNLKNISLEDRGGSYRMIALSVQDRLF